VISDSRASNAAAEPVTTEPVTADPESAEAMPTEIQVPLCAMNPGDCGRIVASRLGENDGELLRAMGMSEHCRLRVCRSGEPCIVQIDSTRLGLSRDMTRLILVTVDG
jgi:Fe2+ transport system protein FeoA